MTPPELLHGTINTSYSSFVSDKPQGHRCNGMNLAIIFTKVLMPEKCLDPEV
jgi:hypothetical protein